MDTVLELSRKMEANLLESCSEYPIPNNIFSPRITRSKTSNGEKCLMNETEISVQPKRNHKKIDEVEKFYLNNKAKVVHKNLETIYEDPIWRKGSTMLLGTSKVKRSLYLGREFRITSKQKSKLRKLKIKRLGKKIKPFKISDEEFQNKMLTIENYINGEEVIVEYQNEDCQVEFICDNNKDCSNSECGSLNTSASDES